MHDAHHSAAAHRVTAPEPETNPAGCRLPLAGLPTGSGRSSPSAPTRSPLRHAPRSPVELAARRAPGLPVGTRVQLQDGRQLTGIVMPYRSDFLPGLLGLFPVQLSNGIWQTCDITDVVVLAHAIRP